MFNIFAILELTQYEYDIITWSPLIFGVIGAIATMSFLYTFGFISFHKPRWRNNRIV